MATARSRAELEPILAAHGQAVETRATPDDPLGTLHHVVGVFLIDRAGRVRNISSSGTLDLRLVAGEVKTLFSEESKKHGESKARASRVLRRYDSHKKRTGGGSRYQK